MRLKRHEAKSAYETLTKLKETARGGIQQEIKDDAIGLCKALLVLYSE